MQSVIQPRIRKAKYQRNYDIAPELSSIAGSFSEAPLVFVVNFPNHKGQLFLPLENVQALPDLPEIVNIETNN
jgi:hypothetical protein